VQVLEEAKPDVLRGLLSTMSRLSMNAEADAARGAGYGQRSAVRRHSTLGIMNPND
jgi:transposase-like protein